MICPICKQRYADLPEEDFLFVGPHGKIKMFFSRITFNLIKRNGYYPKHREAEFNRGIAFGSNEIRCCGDQGCLEVVDSLTAQSALFSDLGVNYNDLVEETKKELAEGKIK